MRRVLPLLLLCLVVLAGIGVYFFYTQRQQQVASDSSPSIVIGSGKTRLTYATHWTQKSQTDGIYENGQLVSKGLKQYLEEYTKLNPEVSFEIKVIPYPEYADKLKLLSSLDQAPDIYQVYSQWGVTYQKEGILDAPPADIVADVEKNYLSTAGVTINGQIWGIPTEINDYALLYNKEILKEIGASVPVTWSQLVNVAAKATKKDAKGVVTRYGIAFLKDNDWQVVDPYLSLLLGNGGQFLSDDNKKALFNSPEGVAALEAELELFKRGATDINANFFDFKDGKVAVVIAPPWVKGGFKESFGADFEKRVGVAPLPYLKKPASLQYGWFMGVTSKSKQKVAAWEFLRWFALKAQPSTNTTRYGDLLADTIGAIPNRKIDAENHASLKDFFTSVYVAQLKNSKAEPNILESNKVKSILMGEIQSAWSGAKTAKQALDSAAAKINNLLNESYK